MKLNKIRKELISFNQFEQITICLIIACAFQFLLFFAPQLVEQAVAKEQLTDQTSDLLVLSPLFKSDNMDPLVANFLEIKQLTRHSYPALTAEAKVIEPEEEILIEWLKEAKEVEKTKVIRSSVHTITAYNSLPEQTNDQPCITANGFNVCDHGVEDTIAANFLSFGTKVRIPDLFGDRIFIVRDRMNQRYPNRVDIWMLERDQAIQFGIRQAKIEIVEYVN